VCPTGTIVRRETSSNKYKTWCELKTGSETILHGPFLAWWANGILETMGQYELGEQEGEWLGWHSTMVVTGDPDQSDLLEGMSGFQDMSLKLSKLENVAVVKLEQSDIVRHPLVAEMLEIL